MLYVPRGSNNNMGHGPVTDRVIICKQIFLFTHRNGPSQENLPSTLTLLFLPTFTTQPLRIGFELLLGHNVPFLGK